jgi:hypothetical protein
MGHGGARWSYCGPAMAAEGQVCHPRVMRWVEEGRVGHHMVLGRVNEKQVGHPIVLR